MRRRDARLLERTAVAAGVSNGLALDAYHAVVCRERLRPVDTSELPPRRVAIYDRERGSKIYMKRLSSSRLLDAEELFWMDQLREEDAATRPNGNRNGKRV